MSKMGFIGAIFLATSFFFACLYWQTKPLDIQVVNPKITITDNYILIHSQEMNYTMEQGQPYSVTIKLKDIEKAIDEYEKNRDE